MSATNQPNTATQEWLAAHGWTREDARKMGLLPEQIAARNARGVRVLADHGQRETDLGRHLANRVEAAQ